MPDRARGDRRLIAAVSRISSLGLPFVTVLVATTVAHAGGIVGSAPIASQRGGAIGDSAAPLPAAPGPPAPPAAAPPVAAPPVPAAAPPIPADEPAVPPAVPPPAPATTPVPLPAAPDDCTPESLEQLHPPDTSTINAKTRR